MRTKISLTSFHCKYLIIINKADKRPQRTLSLPQRQQEPFSPSIAPHRLAQENQYLLLQHKFCLIHAPPTTTIPTVTTRVLETHLILQFLVPSPAVIRTICHLTLILNASVAATSSLLNFYAQKYGCPCVEIIPE